MLMNIVELGAEYDQVDLSNSAAFECIFRRAQTIEWVYHDRIREADAGSSRDRLAPEEMAVFSGVSRAGDTLMVAPQLLEHVKGVTEKPPRDDCVGAPWAAGLCVGELCGGEPCVGEPCVVVP